MYYILPFTLSRNKELEYIKLAEAQKKFIKYERDLYKTIFKVFKIKKALKLLFTKHH